MITSIIAKRERALRKAKEEQLELERLDEERKFMEQSTGLTDDQIEEYREMFNLYDTDKSGSISVTEVRKVMRNAGMEVNNQSVSDIFAEMDIDCNGTIEFNEFLTVMSKVLEDENTDEDMVAVFRILDQDGDGFITKSDLRECCIRVGSQLTSPDMDEMLTEADKDGDGQISFEEFLKILEARS